MPKFGAVPTGQVLKAQWVERREATFDFELHPTLWKNASIGPYYIGRAWTRVNFTNPAPAAVPNASGIYMFVVGPYCGGLADHSYIFYVGKATNLRTRYGRYLKEKDGLLRDTRERVMRFLTHFDGFVTFNFTLVPKADLDHAESLLKDNLTPYANKQVEVIGRL